MTIQMVTAPSRVERYDFEVLKKSPVPGMVAQTAVSMWPQHIQTTSSDDGTHVDKVTPRVDLDRAQCWVVGGAQRTKPSLVNLSQLGTRERRSIALNPDTLSANEGFARASSAKP